MLVCARCPSRLRSRHAASRKGGRALGTYQADRREMGDAGTFALLDEESRSSIIDQAIGESVHANATQNQLVEFSTTTDRPC